MSQSVHIVAVGARTPLGLTAETSMAAVRFGITQVNDHPFIVDRVANPVRLALDSQLDPGLMGPQRLVEMAATAIEEIYIQFEGLLSRFTSVPVLLGLPEERPGWSETNMQMVRDELSQKLASQQLDIYPHGHAAGLMALIVACARIKTGQTEICIVAGVDSYLQSETLQWLDENKQLATSYHRGAFFPGEGAGACLLASESVVNRFNLHSMARIRGGGEAKEAHIIKTGKICLGDGLTECVRKAVDPLVLPHEIVEGIICDINGERYRSEEWGFSLLRVSQVFVDPTDYEAPASCWGDVGAASGPLFIVLAVTAAVKGWAKGKRYLIWCSSEGGQRAALMLELNLQVGGEFL